MNLIKTVSFVLLSMLCAGALMAQKLTKTEAREFKAIALSPNNPLDRTLIVKKWEQPVYYKIYGSGDAEYDKFVAREAASAFKQIKALTGLTINEVTANDSVNFVIIVGKPDKYVSVIGAEALGYLKGKKGNQTYYTIGDNGLNSVVAVIDPGEYSQWPQVRTVVRAVTVYGMGFFGKINFTDRSVFSARPAVLPVRFSAEDSRRIQLMYDPKIRSGMKEADIDAILAWLN